MSNWNSIHVTEDAINAGNDLCMGSDHYNAYLIYLHEQGLVSSEVLENAVQRVVKTKMMAGLLDDNFPTGEASIANTSEHHSWYKNKGIVLKRTFS
ncbi:MAG: hypothetical protein OCD01_06410 [Fibrobacterales bacterium]